MKPVDQEFMHDPDNGIYGDCMRACIASVLELPSSEVPHFLADSHEIDAIAFNSRVNQFLAPKGLALIDLGGFDLNSILGDGHADITHLIYGYTERGTYHAVVGVNGKIVHDPHPSKSGLKADQVLTYGFFISAL